MVARTAGGREVAGSSPVTPTIQFLSLKRTENMKQKISVRALVKHDGRVLLLKRASGRESILGKYELPGGSVSFKEQPEDALARYLETHAGISAESIQLFDVVSFIDPDDPFVQYVFILYLVGLKAVDRSVHVSSLYSRYIWNKLSEIQPNTLTSSTITLLGLAKNEASLQTLSNEEQNSVDKNTSNVAIIYSDGGSRGNPGPSATGFVIMNSKEEVITEGGEYLGITTNNQAEYRAVYAALQKALELGIVNADFRLDSNLVVSQLNGVYKIKNRDLWPIYEKIKELEKQFSHITFTHVRREFNRLADGIVNKVLDERQR